MVGYVFAAGIPLLLVGLFVYGYLANFEMNAKCRSEYEVILPEAACKEPVRLVFLTDLHGWIYGKENEKLLRQVAQGKPGAALLKQLQNFGRALIVAQMAPGRGDALL